MLTYEAALGFLYSFVDYAAIPSDRYSPAHFDLGRMERLMAALGQPQQRYAVVHVAGTKGKGSVAALCASALQAAGYRTGLYTSPHLLDFRERIQLDGGFISRADVAAGVERLQALAADHPGITTFEWTTALAFDHFARAGVQVAVIEVGLGGRLDATNIVRPQVTVITSISLDHVALLGNTLEAIAGEKGGIIKPGIPVVVAPQPPEARARLEQIAAERAAPLALVGRDWRCRVAARSLAGQALEVWPAAEPEARVRLEVPLLGEHQAENTATAFAALRTLAGTGLPVPVEAAVAGFARVRWPGRFQVVGEAPPVVLDGAHNADSAQKLVAALADYFPARKARLVFGSSSDKDVAGMLEALLRPGMVTQVFATRANNPRALDAHEAAERVRQYNTPVEPVPEVAQALASARAAAGPGEVVVVTGSLFVVAEAARALGVGWPALESDDVKPNV
jgi:dihydrofolate synthase/folylpolyglutamate synthase